MVPLEEAVEFSQSPNFTEQEVKNFSAFLVALKKIHIRLMSQGYIIKDGVVLMPESGLKNNLKNDKI